jgi:hypothetical protein
MGVKMKKNIGLADLWIRGLLGLELFTVGLFFLGGFATAHGKMAVLVSAITLVTALCEYSPVYALLRISTRNRQVD